MVILNSNGEYNELDEKWGAWYRAGRYIDHLGGPFRKPSFVATEYIRKNGILMNNENTLENFFD